MSARFEVVHTDAGWIARFIAANGKEVWRTSETYTRRRNAWRALHLVNNPINRSLLDYTREVDERTQEPA